MTKPLTTPLLVARDIIFDCLMVRENVLITPMVARERANNIATALMELLEPRGNVVAGEIAVDEPPPVRGAVPQDETSDETTEEMARRVIR